MNEEDNRHVIYSPDGYDMDDDNYFDDIEVPFESPARPAPVQATESVKPRISLAADKPALLAELAEHDVVNIHPYTETFGIGFEMVKAGKLIITKHAPMYYELSLPEPFTPLTGEQRRVLAECVADCLVQVIGEQKTKAEERDYSIYSHLQKMGLIYGELNSSAMGVVYVKFEATETGKIINTRPWPKQLFGLDESLLIGRTVRWCKYLRHNHFLSNYVGAGKILGFYDDGTLIVRCYRNNQIRLFSYALRKIVHMELRIDDNGNYLPFLRGIARLKNPLTTLKEGLYYLNRVQVAIRIQEHSKALDAQFAREQREWERNSHMDIW